ncbi:MAG: sulfotransferase domain-containing protein [Chlamydiia bacterium]|nr:sulfotransferase domain-containing protein [Chlamydiia bacterium]
MKRGWALGLSLLIFSGLGADWAPDFLIIGAQKAGTTALNQYINQHPLAQSPTKEVHFFDEAFKKGVAWYEQQFPAKPSEDFICGDKSPFYMYHPIVPERVYSLYPQMKLIVILRDPADRAYSQYQMCCRWNQETRSFKEAIEEEPFLMEGKLEKFYKNPDYRNNDFRHKCYLARSRYAEQLERWFQYFPKEQFLIITGEELRAFPQETMDKVFSFLGVESHSIKVKGSDKSTNYTPMDPEIRKALKAYFKPYNFDLERLLKRKFAWD